MSGGHTDTEAGEDKLRTDHWRYGTAVGCTVASKQYKQGLHAYSEMRCLSRSRDIYAVISLKKH
jgi:hypothetical protein